MMSETKVSGSGEATVTLKIINSLDPSSSPAEYQVSVSVGTSVFQMMEVVAKEFPDFTQAPLHEFMHTHTTFHATKNPKLNEHFVDSINGLAGNTADKTYWRFEDGNGVPFDRGVDLVTVHASGEVFVFRFTHWDSSATEHP
uniref:Uncharacterized protein n=1 Tax=Branchiostoma floridae TaxID=7739 RepID=C3Z2V8_BRAFL|eukprot:XP_002597347.1 hypothetical protein BRAFLDRAFT_66483 [Branchiostoma floridae]